MNNINNKICIIVPLYKKVLSDSDKLSLTTLSKQCDKNFDIFFVSPESWKFDDFYDWKKPLGNHTFYIRKFDDKYFESTQSYSYLLTSIDFYLTFQNYDYMCIFQTDCLAFDKFSETILKFANDGWDYVGAPIVSNKKIWKSSPTCGNGGLSLRKIKRMIEIFRDKELIEQLRKEKWEYDNYEDLLICEGIAAHKYIDKPSWEDAATFAFDMNPDTINTKLNILPSAGCHAFGKNIAFWAKARPDLFTDKIIVNEYKKNKVFIDIYYGKEFGESIKDNPYMQVNEEDLINTIKKEAEVWKPQHS